MTSFLGIQMTGEGQDVKEKDIPIDIQYHKLSEWLIDRKKCRRDWKATISPLKERLQAAITELHSTLYQSKQNETLVAIFTKPRERLNYYDVLSIMEEVKREFPDENKTNFIGQYTSQRMQSWYDIIKAYEKDACYLAEASQLLTQLANYEIPAMKKQADEWSKQSTELGRKQNENVKSAATYDTQYKRSCDEFGIEGLSVSDELAALVDGLPALLVPIVEGIQSDDTRLALAMYSAFVNYTRGCDDTDSDGAAGGGNGGDGGDDGSGSDDGSGMCGMLKHVLQFGNETARKYERRLANPSLSCDDDNDDEEEEADEEAVDSGNSGVTIDWGVSEETDVSPSDSAISIDFSSLEVTDVSEDSAPVINIDWDATPDTCDSAAGGDDDGSAAISIDWDMSGIVVEEVAESGGGGEVVVVDAGGGSGGGGGKKARDGELMLARNEYRNKLVDDLLEIHCFLTQRLIEMDSPDETSMMTANHMQQMKGMMEQHDRSSVDRLRTHLTQLLNMMNTKQMRELIEIKTSSRYVERLSASIRAKSEIALRLRTSAMTMAEKQKAIDARIQESYPKMTALIVEVKALKVLIEGSIGEMYGGRPVHIVGDINKL